MGNFKDGGKNKYDIETTHYVLSKFFNKNFDLKACLRQVRLLRQRPNTCSSIVNRDDVFWDPELNVVVCSDATWDEIVRVDPFAFAYTTKGDPHWEDLKVIFGHPTEVHNKKHSKQSDRLDIDVIDRHTNPTQTKPYIPLDEVIIISSDVSTTHETELKRQVGYVGHDSDDADSFKSPSLATEMSSSTPHSKIKGKGRMFGDGCCAKLFEEEDDKGV